MKENMQELSVTHCLIQAVALLFLKVSSLLDLHQIFLCQVSQCFGLIIK